MKHLEAVTAAEYGHHILCCYSIHVKCVPARVHERCSWGRVLAIPGYRHCISSGTSMYCEMQFSLLMTFSPCVQGSN